MSFSDGKPEVSCAHLTKASESAECDRSSNHYKTIKTVEKDAKSTSSHSPLPLWVLKSQCFATWCLQGKGVKAGLQYIHTPHCHIKPDHKTYILRVGPSALNHSHEVVPGNYLQVMFQITLSGRVSGYLCLSVYLWICLEPDTILIYYKNPSLYATCYPFAPLSFLYPHLCCISMRDPEGSRSQEPVSTSARLESPSIPLWLQIIGAGRVPQHGTSTCPKVSCSILILLKELSQTSTWKTWQECAVWV